MNVHRNVIHCCASPASSQTGTERTPPDLLLDSLSLASDFAGDEMTFDRYIGMTMDDAGPDTARIVIEAHHCNPTGNINGGVIISLADNLSTGAANRAYFEKTG